MLTPQEFDEYEMRSSSLTPRLRTELIEFKPTGRSLRPSIKSTKSRSLGGTVRIDMTEEFNPQAQEKQREADNQIKELLGEKRFAESSRLKTRNIASWPRCASGLG